MKTGVKKRIEAELRIMDLNNLKPNYAELTRKYNLDYRTIKKYHEGYEGKPRSRDKPSKLDKYRSVIESKLKIPRITRKGVYEYLLDEYGIDNVGTYSNFKAYCKKNKLEPVGRGQSKGGTTRYETEPGDVALCDWKEDVHMINKNGSEYIVNIFHLELKFSRYSYLELTLSKEQPVVFKCMINAFSYFGGIPNRIIFDNMSTVIDTSVRPKRVNHKFEQFSKDFNFIVTACKARHAYTKGSNEARNKIIDWLRAYNEEFETFEDLQNKIETINSKMNISNCQGTGMSPSLLFFNEKEYLHPLPPQPVIDNYTYPTKVKVSNQQLVLYKGIQYSVDKQYAGEFVSLEEFNDILQIYYKGKLIQIHHISKNPINYMKEHYKQSLGKTIKEEEMEKVISNNLRIMDNILNTRQVTVTKEEASKSTNACIAYLLMRGHESNWIRYFLQTLSKEERIIFLNEISKLLPYVTDESQLFLAFKHGVKKENVKLARVDLWELDLMCCYSFLSQEGYDSIKSDFKEEVDYRLKTLKERWEG